MALPFRPLSRAPNPRPDRPFIEKVHGYLSTRRPLTTELYVIGCEYIPIAIAAGITIGEGFERDTVINEVREALRRFLWPLTPGGPERGGWPVGRAVRDREIEVTIARVAGVNGVLGINLFRRERNDWQKIVAPRIAEVSIGKWQLPELLAVVVVADTLPPDVLTGRPLVTGGGVGGIGEGAGGATGIAVPVVPEIC